LDFRQVQLQLLFV